MGYETYRRKDNKNIWITYSYVHDGWMHNFVYISKPPYQSYALFSMGPDGKYNENDPLNTDDPKNKDNIYGTAGGN